MSIKYPEEVPGTGIELYSAAVWNRTTIADGKWLQNNTLEPIYENEKILASAVHDTSASLYDSIEYLSGAHDDLREDLIGVSGNLQSEIDTINAGSDVIDVVNDLSALSAYSNWTTSADVIKVLNDSAHEDEQTYYRWTGGSTTDPSTSAYLWDFVGGVSPYYTKSEMDSFLSKKMDNSESSAFYPRYSNPEGYLVQSDLAGYATESWVSDHTSAFVTQGDIDRSISGKMDKSQSADFYPRYSNPEGYLTSVPTGYVTSGDMQAYVAQETSGFIDSGYIGNGRLNIKKNNTSVGTFSANQPTSSDIDIKVPYIYVPGNGYSDDVHFRLNTGKGLTYSIEEDQDPYNYWADMTVSLSPEPTIADSGKMFSVDSSGNTIWSTVPTEVLYVDYANPQQTVPQILQALNAGKLIYTIVTYDNSKYILPFKRTISNGGALTIEFADIIDVENHGVTELYWRMGSTLAIRRHTESLTPLTTPVVVAGGNLAIEEGKYYACILDGSSININIKAPIDTITNKPVYDYPVHTILQIGVTDRNIECSVFTLYWHDETGQERYLMITPESTSQQLQDDYYYAFDITVQAFETNPGSGQYWFASRVRDLPCSFRSRGAIGTGSNSTNAMIGLYISE